MAISFQATEQEGIDLALKKWPTSDLSGAFKFELPMPKHFEEATLNVTAEQIAESIICSRDPQNHIEALRKYEDAGYTRVYVRQSGAELGPSSTSTTARCSRHLRGNEKNPPSADG